MKIKPKFKLSHEENRKKVCAGCGDKIVFGNRKIQSLGFLRKYKNYCRLFQTNTLT